MEKKQGPFRKAEPWVPSRRPKEGGWLQDEVNQYVIFSTVSQMIPYGVTVYNAILIISYHIITYKLIYITAPEEHQAYSMGWPQAHNPSAGPKPR